MSEHHNILDSDPPDAAFTRAIRQGRLSDQPQAANYAGKYMYMGRDRFKNVDTRAYLPRYPF